MPMFILFIIALLLSHWLMNSDVIFIFYIKLEKALLTFVVFCFLTSGHW